MPTRVNTNTGVSTNTNTGSSSNIGGVGSRVDAVRPSVPIVVSGGGGGQIVSGGDDGDSDGWGAPSGWGGGGTGWGSSESQAQIAAELAAARKRAQDVQSRRDNANKIAMDAFGKQRDRREEKKQEQQVVKAQQEARSQQQTRAQNQPASVKSDSADKSGWEVLDRRKKAPGWDSMSPEAKEYYSIPTISKTEPSSLDEETLSDSDALDQYYKETGPIFAAPNGNKGTEDELRRRRNRMIGNVARTADRLRRRDNLEKRIRSNARQTMDRMKDRVEGPINDAMRQRLSSELQKKIDFKRRMESNVERTMDRMRGEFEKPINAAMRQRLSLGARDAMRKIDESRYQSPSEIREAIEESYVTTPSKGSSKTFKFVGDEAFEPRMFDADVKDEDIMKKFLRLGKESVKRDQSGKKMSPQTSVDAQRNGYVEYDPDTTVSDNVRHVNEAARSTADIIKNPLLIRIEGDIIERTPDENDPRYITARIRHMNEEGRDVEGAIGLIRRKYGCSHMSALRLVFTRLGLGVDTHGKICGKSIEDFELPSVVFIEAANDIVKSQDEYGIPTAIVEGRSGGYNYNSRDETGMFPVLGGTLCFPFPYITNDMFDDISRDPNSPLHGKSREEFNRACALTFMNDTQPILLANTTGPLAWQNAAFTMGARGIMSIDGANPDAFNLPEHKVNRTKSQIQAEIADAGDEAVKQALQQKLVHTSSVMSRWANMNFKDGGKRSNGTGNDIAGSFIGPGERKRRSVISNVFSTLSSVGVVARVLHLANIMTAPLEAGLATAEQQVVISFQSTYKNRLQNKWHMGDRFNKTEYLTNVMNQTDAIESIEVAQTLMAIGGRTALEAFMYEKSDRLVGPRYRMTKKDMYDFLDRWGVNQSPDVVRRISQFTSKLMIGEGMFKKRRAQQFLDMALYEMALREVKGVGEGLSSEALEEIARSGEVRSGAGESLVRSLLDTTAGYEAFKSIDVTGLSRTTPWARAVQVVMQQHGVTEFAIRQTIGNFFRYGINSLYRVVPMSNTISYIISNSIRKGMIVENEAMDMANAFARGFDKVTDMVSRISDYQVGMDSPDFMSGLYKNIAYDVVMFGGNYLVLGAIIRGVLALFGGIEPPEDKTKITLIEEWTIKGLGVPIKAAWFMSDLIGCGLPLAYSWAIAEGWDEKDANGNVIGHVDGMSDKALGVASSAFLNAVKGFNEGNFVIDAIDFVTNFHQNIDDIANWQSIAVDEVSKYYGDDAANKSEADMRMEWLMSRCECILWDLFGDLTPPMINEIFPGTRDSLWGGDKYQHSTKLMYNIDDYDLDTAKKEWRTKGVSYQDSQRMRRTQDNFLAAFFADVFDAREGIEYQYENMPIDTVKDQRELAGESFEKMFSLPLETNGGSPNLDLSGPDGKPDGKPDTAEERQTYLFGRAEEVCQYIYDKYMLSDGYPEKAIADGFVIPFEARINAINYCYYMIGKNGKIWSDFYARKEVEGHLPDADYNDAQAEEQKYKDILYNYLNNEDIPWRTPRYAHLKTDTNKMYVDDQGNATNAFAPNAREITYDYGNVPNGLFPFMSPRDTGLYDYNSRLWDVMLDDDGNPINDMGRIWDQMEAGGDITKGRWAGENLLERSAGGQGPHDTDIEEQLALSRGDILTFGRRAWEPFEGTYPDELKNPTADFIGKLLGIASYIPGEETNKPASDETSNTANAVSLSQQYGGSSYGGSGGSYRRSYGGGGGGYYLSRSSGGYSSYNPKIYNTSRQVNGDRASGLQIRQPYKATSTYLRPNFYTKGSREAYKRSDI